MPPLDLNESELIAYLEIALVALTIMPETVGKAMDVTDDHLESLRAALYKYLNEPST